LTDSTFRRFTTLDMKNVFWLFAFIFSLFFLAGAYYVTSPSVRAAIDPRAPWVAGVLGPYVRGAAEPVQARPAASPSPVLDLSDAPVVTAVPAATPVPVPAEPEPFNLEKLAANRAAWPAKVTLAKATDFPAVVNGKVLG